MLETLFGADTPLFVRFLVALVVVFGLIAVTFWLVRRFSADRLNAQGARNRQPRLAVIDAATVDGRRRLVLIRRDNIEHLLIIGGPTDVVIETNIVRATAATRDPAPAIRPPPDAAVRPPQLEDATSWPLQPETAPKPRPAIPEDTPGWVPQPIDPARARPSDALAGLAADLSAGRPMAQSSLGRAAPAPEPRMTPPPLVGPSPTPVAVPSSTADQNLAEMAFRLEAALRRPGVGPTPVKPMGGAQPPGPQMPGPQMPDTPIEPRPIQPQAKSPYGNLEQEMASLLSRPPGKT